jgi:glycosyltransferase involved in cell wall biosynthesis
MTADVALPLWWPDLWLRLVRREAGMVMAQSGVDPAGLTRLQALGWTEVPQPQRGGAVQPDGLIAVGVPKPVEVAALAEDGLVLFSLGTDFQAAAAQRQNLERQWGWTLHLFDPATDGVPILAFGWKGRQVRHRRIRVLLVLPAPDAAAWGGAEAQAIETAVALRDWETRADLACSLRLVLRGIDVVHLFGLGFADQVPFLDACPVPVVVSPLFWDRTEAIVGAQMSTAFLAKGSESEAWFTAWRQGGLNLTTAVAAAAQVVSAEVATARPVLAAAQWVLVGGPREAAHLDRQFGPLHCPVTVAPVGVNAGRAAESRPEPFCERFGKGRIVLCLGPLEPRMNQAMLIHALWEEPVDLVLIGPEPEPAYSALCRLLAGPRVRFLGEQPPDIVASALAAALVHVSPAWSDVSLQVTLDAALAGCNLVVAHHSEAPTYLGPYAETCQPADWLSIRAAVVRAMTAVSPERAARNSLFVAERYPWRETVRVVQGCYEAVLLDAARR